MYLILKHDLEGIRSLAQPDRYFFYALVMEGIIFRNKYLADRWFRTSGSSTGQKVYLVLARNVQPPYHGVIRCPIRPPNTDSVKDHSSGGVVIFGSIFLPWLGGHSREFLTPSLPRGS